MFSKISDMLWVIIRHQVVQDGKAQSVPSWTGFFNEVSNTNSEKLHSIHYLPAIDQSPTRFDTVQEVLRQVKAKAEALGLMHTDLVLDHAIYTKALEVLSNPTNLQLQSFINLRMGPFHACCIFLAILGKRFGSAGLLEIIVEANLAGPGSVDAILRGKHYNRAMRVMKTVYEALFRLKIEAFENWMQDAGNSHVVNAFLESQEIVQLIETRTPTNLQKVIIWYLNAKMICMNTM